MRQESMEKKAEDQARELARMLNNECQKRVRFGGNREKALKRDGYKCVVCGMTRKQHKATFGLDVVVDHKDGNGRYSENKNHDIDNLQTLCSVCHGRKGTTGNPKPKIVVTKKCRICREEKPIEMYHFKRPNVRQNRCKVCDGVYNRLRYYGGYRERCLKLAREKYERTHKKL